MSIRQFTLTCLAFPYVPKPEGTREDQLNTLIDLAQRRLFDATREGQPSAIRTATHFVIASQAMLNRWLDRHSSEDGQSTDADPNGIGMTNAEYYATIQLLRSDPEINEKWIALVAEMEKQYPS
jgi:hypothetical protein